MKKTNHSMRLAAVFLLFATLSAHALVVDPGVIQNQLDGAPLVLEVLVTKLDATPDSTFRAILLATATITAVVRNTLTTAPAIGDTIQIAGVGGEVGQTGVMYSGLPRPYVSHHYRAFLNPRSDGNFDVQGFERGLIDLDAPAHPQKIWTRNRTDGSDGAGTGPFLYWAPSYFPLSYFISAPTFIGHSGFPEAIDASFKTWRDVQDAKVEYVGLGCTSSNESNDGINTVVLVTNNWQFDPGAIAITRNFYISSGSPQAGLILNSDILLNGQDHNFTTTNETGKYDVQDIVTHEAGHFIGMGHEVEPDADPTATMYPTASPNETTKRVLKQHDLDGLHAAYGGVGIKDGFQHSTCNLSDGTSCASVHRPATPLNILAAILFLAALLSIPTFLNPLLKVKI